MYNNRKVNSFSKSIFNLFKVRKFITLLQSSPGGPMSVIVSYNPPANYQVHFNIDVKEWFLGDSQKLLYEYVYQFTGAKILFKKKKKSLRKIFLSETMSPRVLLFDISHCIMVQKYDKSLYLGSYVPMLLGTVCILFHSLRWLI
jgi:hypothetical protein